MDVFSLDAVDRDIRTFISVLLARGLPSLASTVSNTTYSRKTAASAMRHSSVQPKLWWASQSTPQQKRCAFTPSDDTN
jgi:hypothetical protein